VEQRPLGSTGLSVSALGFGCGNIGGLMIRGDPIDQREAVARALDAGVRYFDTAPLYGNGRSEENLGHVLRELDAWSSVVVGTKLRLTADDVGGGGDVRAVVRRSLQASLGRLGRDGIDLVQLHNPVLESASERDRLDLEAARDAVAPAMQELVREGLVRHIGFTGLGATAAAKALAASGRFGTVQSYINALNPSAAFAGSAGDGQDFDGLVGAAGSAGLGVIAIRVMAAGALAGTPERAVNAGDPGGPLARGGFAHDVERARSLEPLARELGLEGALELSFRFVIAVPGISTALVGCSNRDQLESAIRWVERGPLPAGAVQRIVAAAGGA
jgi:aryl-alcohol dehydrogenase-like predicted oxidoreductase